MRDNSPGRDAAFELYVGAVCADHAEFYPVDFEEPDITCVWQGTKYAFAAKRIKNEKNLIRRVREATDQIARSGLQGVIGFDTCLAFNPENLRF